MTFTKLSVAVAAAVAFGAAHASAPLAVESGGNLGINPSNVPYLAEGNGDSEFDFSLVDLASAGSFTTFSLSVSMYSVFKPVTVSAINVTGPSFTQTINPASGSSLATFSGLGAGAYKLTFTNSARGFAGLTGTVTAVGTVTPVPEAETYALALAGLGVVGLVAARRRKV